MAGEEPQIPKQEKKLNQEEDPVGELQRLPSEYESDTQEFPFTPPPKDEEDRADDFGPLSFSKNGNPQVLRVKNLFHEILVTPNIIERLHSKDLFPKKEAKQILRNISFAAHPGHFVAILGSSGSGKTTLLDILACRTKTGKLEGEVLLNDEPATQKKIKALGAYVTQHDQFIPHLTVRESTMFVANMVFPSSVSSSEKVERVDTVLAELGLVHVADSMIGGERLKGISGGEKRRVSIACQLLLDPSIIFLDEPTSGLDSFTAAYIIETLVSMAKSDRTVIATIHSPSDAIFRCFDQVMLLTQGEIVYFGQAKSMVPYFGGLGFECPSYTNPCDYFMDVASIDFRTQETIDKTRETVKFLIEKYHGEAGATLVRLGSAPLNKSKDPSSGGGFFIQFWYLYLRATKTIFLNYWGLIWEIFLAAVIGLLIGVTFWDLGLSQFSINDRVGLLFEVSVLYTYVNILAFVAKFHHERSNFYANFQDGLYSVSPYLLAKILSELPFDFLFTLVNVIPIYLLSGLKNEGQAFGVFLAIVFFINYATRSLALAISASFVMLKFANFMANLIYVLLFLATSGYLINLESVTPWFGWVTEISLARFALQALVKNEFTGLVFECSEGTVGCILTGEEAIEELGFGGRPIRDNILYLVTAIITFTAIQYLALRFIPQKGL